MANASLLNIALTGLRASQLALNTTGHNIANANTPGFTRQRVEQSSIEGQFFGAGFQGSGTRPDNIRRITDQFLSGQIRLDSSRKADLDAFLQNAGQLDGLLADPVTGLAPAVEGFFAAMHAASTDPTSVPARRLVLAQGESLSTRFHTLFDRLSEQSATVEAQLSVSTQRLTTLARGVAEINDAVQLAQGRGTQQPNDLLDQREELLRQMALEVDVSVVQQEDGQLNVFVGSGQALVIGDEARVLKVDDGTGDVLLEGGGRSENITRALTGGQLGGLLRSRESVVNVSLNHLGRLALVISQTINEQHREGIDLRGRYGNDLFTDILGDAGGIDRVTRTAGSSSGELSVRIDDASRMEISDYEVQFVGPGDTQFQVRRSSDGSIVAKGSVGQLPQTLSFDALTLSLDGGEFRRGDRFRIQPSHFGARDFNIALKLPEELALASPVKVAAARGNQGSGHIDNAEVLDRASQGLGSEQALTPPLMVRFTSETTYDILDATDPIKPVPLNPPMTGLTFVPGNVNQLFANDPGTRQLISDGARAGVIAATATILSDADIAAGGFPSNQYLVENLTFIKQEGGSEQNFATVATAAGASARTIAQSINAVAGVSARATTSLRLTDLVNDRSGVPMAVGINGVEFSVNNLNELADAITQDAALQAAGVRAQSDGTTLTLLDAQGDDIRLQMRGDATDSIRVLGERATELSLNGVGAGQSASLVGIANRSRGFDFRVGGPYEFALALNGGAPANITLTGVYASGVELVSGLQSAIDSALGAGQVVVSMTANGEIAFNTVQRGRDVSLELSNAPSSSAIAGALGISNGIVRGANEYQGVTVGGRVSVTLAPNLRMEAEAAQPAGSLFRRNPQANNIFFGYQVELSGRPAVGDQFLVDFNRNGAGDNRNGLRMANLETKPIVGSGLSTYADSYGELVQLIGAKTAEARVDAEAAAGLVAQSTALRESISGVNLDEEAADLLRFEHAYNASARVITVARSLFDSLLAAFR